MSNIKSIISDIENLPIEDLELLLQKIINKLNKSNRFHSIISEYKGIGEGIWKEDAQSYIENLRKEDRK